MQKTVVRIFSILLLVILSAPARAEDMLYTSARTERGSMSGFRLRTLIPTLES